MSNNELQNNDFILPGGLGTVQVGDQVREIKSIFNSKDGSCTITIGEKIAPLMVNGVEIKGIGICFPEKQITTKQ